VNNQICQIKGLNKLQALSLEKIWMRN